MTDSFNERRYFVRDNGDVIENLTDHERWRLLSNKLESKASLCATPSEAARALHISTCEVRKMLESGTLEKCQIDGDMICRRSLDAVLHAGKTN